MNQLEKELKKESKISLSNTNNDYLKAYYVNNNFAYFETELISNYVLVFKFKRNGIIYDSSKNKFVVLDKNTKLNDFLSEHIPNQEYNIPNNEERPNLNIVRNIVFKLFENEK